MTMTKKQRDKALAELLAAAEKLLWNMPAPRSFVRMAEWIALNKAISIAKGESTWRL